MAYIGNQPTDNFVTFATQDFSTSATSSYTLSHAVSNENEIALFINNVRQHPGSGKAYTASGTALTLSANTASTDVMYCIFLGRAIQSTVPATNSIDRNMITTVAASAISSPAFSVHVASNQSLSNSTATLLAHATEVFDTNNVFTNTSSNYKFTPGISGKYLLIASLHVDNLTDQDEIASLIYKNGSSIGGGTRCFSGQNGDFQIITTAVVESDTDDYFQHYGFQVSGGALNAKAGAGITYFQGFKLA